jgi:urate oxidase
MSVGLASNQYGKSRVRMMKVRRLADRHEVRDLNVTIALQGDFTAAHTVGDNSKVLPTDTMKNTVYALGKGHAIETIEFFAADLASHFVKTVPHVSRARVEIRETIWERAVVAGSPHRHTFIQPGGERNACVAMQPRGGSVAIESGIEGLVILKTTDSAFSGFLRDRYTTLKETEDRLLGTSVTAWWMSAAGGVTADFGGARRAVRRALIEAFAQHMSASVQHTLLEMGRRALEACPAVERISLSLPNKHCLLVDLSPFGMTNENEVFLPIDEPHGLIEATIERS